MPCRFLIRRAAAHAGDWEPPAGTWARVGEAIHYPPGHFLHLASQVESFAAFPAFNAGPDPSVRLPDSSAKLIVLRKCL